jgi:hypothetical protein
MWCDPPTDLPPTVEVVPDEDWASVLAEAIHDGKSGRMVRHAEVFLATVCAEFLASGSPWQGVCGRAPREPLSA